MKNKILSAFGLALSVLVLPALPASAATVKAEFSGLASGNDGSNLFGGGDF